MSDSKKNTSTKKINIKNKKEAAKVLNKKSTTIAKKNISGVKPKTNTKKTPVKKEKIADKLNNEKKIKKVATEKKVLAKKNSKLKNKSKKEEIKLVLPKEWQQIPKKTKTKNGSKQGSSDISTKLKESIFEEVDYQQIKNEKKVQKEKAKKDIINISIVLLIVIIVVFIIFKYKDSLKKELKIYSEYYVGEKIMLADGNNWYVIKDSLNDSSTVKLLKEYPLDINSDKKIDEFDKVKYYSSKNENIYDKSDKSSIAYYLNHNYRQELESYIGEVEEISLLTSKEFVNVRNKMGYGYEWYEGNWLANNSIGTWWIDSTETGKTVKAVSSIGSYKVYKATEKNYVRPTITINKEILEK